MFLIGKSVRRKPRKHASVTLLVVALQYVFWPELLLCLSKFWGNKLSEQFSLTWVNKLLTAL